MLSGFDSRPDLCRDCENHDEGGVGTIDNISMPTELYQSALTLVCHAGNFLKHSSRPLPLSELNAEADSPIHPPQ